MRIGVLGGTFDPPHLGHYLTAIDAFERLALSELLFVPNARQPFKDPAAASPQQRFEMLRLMVGVDSRFKVEPIEIERNGLSYTVDTLEELKTRRPSASYYFLAGADVLASFSQWRDSARILNLSTLVVLRRRVAAAGSSGADEPLAADLPAGAVGVTTRVIDISSTEVRERVRTGKSIRGFVSEGVAEFIEHFGLYSRVNE